MSANIFISFASQDRKVAMTLCSALESRGFKCWISARDIQPGENFQSAIVRAIRQSKIMLLVFTSNSNNSEEMNKELALASQSKLIVVPLRIEDVAPNDAFAYEFATRQWIDFFADWEFAVQQLAQRIAAATREAAGVRAAFDVADPEPAAPEPPPERAAAIAEEPSVAPLAETPAPAAASERQAPAFTELEAEAPPPRSRARLFVGLSAAAALVLGAGLILPGVLRHKPAAAPQQRIMAAVHPSTPAGVQQVSIQVAPDPALAPPPPPAPPIETGVTAATDEAPAVEKPAAHKKKAVSHAAAATRSADNYVPY